MQSISLLKAKVHLIFILLFLSFSAFAQAPNLLNYQGVARNTVGNPLPNQTMKLRLSIHDLLPSGVVVYSETRQITTNLGGLFSVQIGSAGASSSSGTLGGVNWIEGNKFLHVELDPASNNNYIDIGTVQLVSVPYSFYASKTDTSVLNLTSRFSTKLNATDTASLSSRINAISNLSDTSLLNLSNRFSTKLNATDTAYLSSRINSKSNLSDTSLLNLSNRFSMKLNATDTASLSNRINAISNLSDTSLLNLSNRFSTKLNATDTAYLSSRINSKSNLSDTSLLNLSNRFSTKFNTTDTSLLNLSNRFSTKLNTTDTVSLSNRIYSKLNKTDTSAMLSGYLRITDTASLSNRINSKLNSTVFPYYPGLQKGHIMYWNGSSWVLLNPGSAGQVLKMTSAAEPVPVWGTVATTSVPAFSPCGATISDIDGNSYNTVLIGAQCWTKENLRVRRYNNGTAIEFDNRGGAGGSSSTWQNSTIGAYSIYAHDSVATPSNRTKYGYLYNWYAAKGIYTTGTIVSTDTLNICPSGWHVPTDAEWTTLTDELGGESVAGGTMKSVRTAYWKTPNTGATNESGFSALPGGFRNNDGSFINIGSNAFFWSATEHDYDDARYRTLANTDSSVSSVINYKTVGASVRCIRD